MGALSVPSSSFVDFAILSYEKMIADVRPATIDLMKVLDPLHSFNAGWVIVATREDQCRVACIGDTQATLLLRWLVGMMNDVVRQRFASQIGNRCWLACLPSGSIDERHLFARRSAVTRHGEQKAHPDDMHLYGAGKVISVVSRSTLSVALQCFAREVDK